ncbi:formin-J-like isoform X2 [Ruditapes philippinarum]|nr:formin-J-like isoform X2 [Ruditapes philippinarum]XP_060558470.1 formin-J-like isoform X2 [Ruditapes philippinarum]
MDYEENNSMKMPVNEGPTSAPKILVPDERSLNFSTSPGEEFDFTFVKKPKTIRDPMSHRIIEKRRRDRMNNCLADLSRLIPTNYLKQGQGRIEKTEIIEMAIRHIKNLTNKTNTQGGLKSSLPDRFLGFKECQDEVMRYLVEVEGWDAHDQLCSRMMSHLEQAGEKFRIMNDESLSQAAKEEQYRHVEEDIHAVHNGQTIVLEPGGTGPPPQFYPSPPQNTAQITTPPQPAAQSENTSPQNSFPSFESFASAQQITQEHLKRDKHLWTLLASKYNAKNVVEDSGLSTGPGSNISNTTDSSMKYSGNGSYKIPLEPVPTLNNSSSQTSMDTSSDRNDSSVYKFKHNITKRFSEETTPKMANPSDSSSISSREDQKRCEKMKRKFRHVRSRSPSSISSQYPNSDSSNNNSSSNGESSSTGDEVKPSCYLPGFVLHPVGTHYIPLSIHPSNVGYDFFAKATQQGPRVFHPISIPVNFGGPLIYMKNIGIESKANGSGVQSLSSEGSNSRCPSGCPSENSPNPEPEPVKSAS